MRCFCFLFCILVRSDIKFPGQLARIGFASYRHTECAKKNLAACLVPFSEGRSFDIYQKEKHT